MPVVRTVFQPTVDLEVSDAEAVSLGKQGLLVQPEPEPEPVPAPPAARAPKGADKTVGV